MATSKRVQTRAAVPGFSSISIVTLAILCLLSIASVAALPHISSPGSLEEDDSLAFSRRDETDPPPAYGDTSTFPFVPGPPEYGAPPDYYGPLRYERPDLEEKLTTMTDDYPLVTELPLGEMRKGQQPPKKWTFSLNGEQKLLEIPWNSGHWAWDRAILQKNSRTQVLQRREQKAVQTISEKAGLVWSTLLDKSVGSKFIFDMQLLYTNEDCPEWWTVTPPRTPLSKEDFYRMENSEPPVPFENRLLRTLDVIEGIAHMHDQSLSYFYLSTGSVNVIMEDPKKVPKEFKGKKWIRQLQLSQFRHASDLKAYESRGPLESIRSTDLNYCQSSEMIKAKRGNSKANDVWTVGVFMLIFLVGRGQDEHVKNACTELQNIAAGTNPSHALDYLRDQNETHGWNLSNDILELLARVLVVYHKRINIEQLKARWTVLPEYRAAAKIQ